jgi:hypothetical protein
MRNNKIITKNRMDIDALLRNGWLFALFCARHFHCTISSSLNVNFKPFENHYVASLCLTSTLSIFPKSRLSFEFGNDSLKTLKFEAM